MKLVKHGAEERMSVRISTMCLEVLQFEVICQPSQHTNRSQNFALSN